MANIMGNYGNAPATPSQTAYLDAYKSMVTPAGMDYGQYIDGKMSPKSPLDRAIENAYSNSQGDKDYQVDEINQYYQSPAGKKEMADFYAANSQWYNPDGSRTDYKMSPLDLQSKEWFDNNQVGPNPVSVALREYAPDTPRPVGANTAGSNPDWQGPTTIGETNTPIPALSNPPTATPAPAPTPPPQTPAPVARPSIVNMTPAGQQQPQQAAAIRNFAPTANPNSSWQAGGWS